MACKTVILKQSLSSDVATEYYTKLLKLPWTTGIASRNGFTRMAYSVSLSSPLGEELVELVYAVLREIGKIRRLPFLGYILTTIRTELCTLQTTAIKGLIN